jgi:Family of unknown function (DUF5331)
VNIEQLRQALKDKWLVYYRDNRPWLTRLGVWVNCEGQRRPSSSFILATLSVLEPELTALLPLVVDLNSNPDRIVIALGLNFNPDRELQSLREVNAAIEDVKLLPAGNRSQIPSSDPISRVYAKRDEACEGRE